MDQYPTLAAPSGRAGVTLAVASMETRFKTYGWGEHPDVINPGDMLIIFRPQPSVQVAMTIRGKDMAGFARAAQQCADLYAENADWLSAPINRLAS
jgi:hypothetical protein